MHCEITAWVLISWIEMALDKVVQNVFSSDYMNGYLIYLYPNTFIIIFPLWMNNAHYSFKVFFTECGIIAFFFKSNPIGLDLLGSIHYIFAIVFVFTSNHHNVVNWICYDFNLLRWTLLNIQLKNVRMELQDLALLIYNLFWATGNNTRNKSY